VETPRRSLSCADPGYCTIRAAAQVLTRDWELADRMRQSRFRQENFTMNKTDLIARIAEEIGGTKTESEAYLNSVVAQITKALAAGESVVLPGFGTFEVRARAARTGRNPQTGETIQIAAAKVPAFKPGSLLKKGVSAG
jgi:DNA-binding protein HU-beta